MEEYTDEQVRLILYRMGWGTAAEDKKPIPEGSSPREFLADLQAKADAPPPPPKKAKPKAEPAPPKRTRRRRS